MLTAALLVAVLAVRQRSAPRALPAVRGPRPQAPELPAPGPRDGWRPVLLRARGVTAAYGAVRALDGVDLVLRAGEVHALIGPNGSGKSTLLQVLAGDLPPGDGEVEVAGRVHVARGPADRVRRGVARTPQRTVLLERLTPAEQVAVGARGGAAGPAGRAAPPARHAVLGTPAAGARPGRRGGAARHRPGREPATTRRGCPWGSSGCCRSPARSRPAPRCCCSTSRRPGCRPTSGAGSSACCARLAGNGAAVLLVEHDMRLVGEVADRVTVLDRGRVLAAGRPQDVRDDPAVRRAYLGGPA